MESETGTQIKNKEFLVALLLRTSALDILKNEGWYHIPVDNAPKRWPPEVMAFYQGRVFGKDDAYQIRYYGEVKQIDVVPRRELFPDDKENQYKAEKLYYQIQLDDLLQREMPIISYRPRRLVFVPTTQAKFEAADQINDLFDGSPLEDRLWSALKYINILAERQWKIIVENKNYYLDFAIFCKKGKLAIETDGYTYHYDDRNQIDYDTWRRNDIEMDGWRSLHYTTKQVKDDWTPYLAQIQTVIKQLGGLEEPRYFERNARVQQGKYIVDGEEPL